MFEFPAGLFQKLLGGGGIAPGMAELGDCPPARNCNGPLATAGADTPPILRLSLTPESLEEESGSEPRELA